MSAELRRLLSEATPGPWTTGPAHVVRREYRDGQGRRCIDWVADVMGSRTFPEGQNEADARLIVAAVNDLPALLDVVDAARRLRDDLVRSQLRWVSDEYDAFAAAIDKLEEPHD